MRRLLFVSFGQTRRRETYDCARVSRHFCSLYIRFELKSLLGLHVSHIYWPRFFQFYLFKRTHRNFLWCCFFWLCCVKLFRYRFRLFLSCLTYVVLFVLFESITLMSLQTHGNNIITHIQVHKDMNRRHSTLFRSLILSLKRHLRLFFMCILLACAVMRKTLKDDDDDKTFSLYVVFDTLIHTSKTIFTSP